MTHQLRKAATGIAAIGFCCFSTISVLAQPQQRPPQSGSGRTQPAGKPSNPANSANGWKEFKSPAGKFAVSMPTAPKTSVKDGTYMFESSNYLLTYADAKSPAEAKSTVEGLPDVLVESLKAKMTRKQNISIKNNPGIDFEFVSSSNNNQKGRAQLYAVGNRVYMLFTTTPGAEADRFFKSFRLL
jgi:hypothetical protein